MNPALKQTWVGIPLGKRIRLSLGLGFSGKISGFSTPPTQEGYIGTLSRIDWVYSATICSHLETTPSRAWLCDLGGSGPSPAHSPLRLFSRSSPYRPVSPYPNTDGAPGRNLPTVLWTQAELLERQGVNCPCETWSLGLSPLPHCLLWSERTFWARFTFWLWVFIPKVVLAQTMMLLLRDPALRTSRT